MAGKVKVFRTGRTNPTPTLTLRIWTEPLGLSCQDVIVPFVDRESESDRRAEAGQPPILRTSVQDSFRPHHTVTNNPSAFKFRVSNQAF
jgi:hypothetical protein